MEIVDAQIHCWPVTKTHHWHPSYRPLRHDDAWPIDSVLSAMESVGIDAAMIDMPGRGEEQPDGSLRFDNTYMEEVGRRYPGIIASTVKYDHRSPEIEELVAETRNRPGVLGIRVILISHRSLDEMSRGGFDRLLAAAEKYEIPVLFMMTERLEFAEPIARAHPNLQMIVDHLGLPQPPTRQRDNPPFRRLPELMNLAQFPNIAVKFIGAPAYSLELYPYRDIWPHLHKVITAFGPKRLMWGSDATRFRGLFVYSELLDYLRYTDELSDIDKEMMLGVSLRRILRWPRLDRDRENMSDFKARLAKRNHQDRITIPGVTQATVAQ